MHLKKKLYVEATNVVVIFFIFKYESIKKFQWAKSKVNFRKLLAKRAKASFPRVLSFSLETPRFSLLSVSVLSQPKTLTLIETRRENRLWLLTHDGHHLQIHHFASVFPFMQ